MTGPFQNMSKLILKYLEHLSWFLFHGLRPYWCLSIWSCILFTKKSVCIYKKFKKNKKKEVKSGLRIARAHWSHYCMVVTNAVLIIS